MPRASIILATDECGEKKKKKKNFRAILQNRKEKVEPVYTHAFKSPERGGQQ